ncbi:hypothetical protein JQ596_37905 [Bradyrhizobium manausense]|uniref:hypothetical protein n=1 Tax=Bradyrhizobium manausense TaxID=989370 RepID=UPI001BA8BF67|nr:hypothetical protein [Bradyrhizobium manausense]MBR0831296.1 hypothetical protein [Bradyrhizobium manausense]
MTRHREIDVRHHALMQQQEIHGDGLGLPTGHIAHADQLAVAACCNLGHSGDHLNLRLHLAHHGEAFCEIRRGEEREGGRQRDEVIAALHGIKAAVDAATEAQDLRGQKPEQWPLPRNQGAAIRHQRRRFQHRYACA